MENSNPHLATLIQLRKELHQNPEVSGKEVTTAKRILSFLENYPPDTLIPAIGGAGIVALYKGKTVGKTVLFRCELDALPIDEPALFAHSSIVPGVSHKCGHDGHMAILCGLAIALHHKRPEMGTVILMFQPAEEDGSGAQKIYSDPKFASLQPDYVFALHNLPGFPKNQIVVKNGTFTCAVSSMIIKLNGVTAHAGEPEKGINPALAIALMITEFDKRIQLDISKPTYCLITPIYTTMGKKAYGVAAGAGELHYTVRSNSNLHLQELARALEELANKIAIAHQLKCAISWTQAFKANENNETAVNHVREAAAITGYSLLEKEVPFSWGEDFGWFTQQFPGAMFGLGAGIDTPALHHPDYDFPDDCIAAGLSIFHQISKQITHEH